MLRSQVGKIKTGSVRDRRRGSETDYAISTMLLQTRVQGAAAF